MTGNVPAAAVLDALKQLSHDIRGAIRACGTSELATGPAAAVAAVAAAAATCCGRACCCCCTCCQAFATNLLCLPMADLDVGTSVRRHQQLPALDFLRDYVSANKPVVLTGEGGSWG